jgi:hypothetical protein
VSPRLLATRPLHHQLHPTPPLLCNPPSYPPSLCRLWLRRQHLLPVRGGPVGTAAALPRRAAAPRQPERPPPRLHAADGGLRAAPAVRQGARLRRLERQLPAGLRVAGREQRVQARPGRHPWPGGRRLVMGSKRVRRRMRTRQQKKEGTRSIFRQAEASRTNRRVQRSQEAGRRTAAASYCSYSDC